MPLVHMMIFMIGGLIIIFGNIMLLVAGFQQGLGWGLGMLFLQPFAPIAFFFSHWDAARKPFFVQLFGLILVLAGFGSFARSGATLASSSAFQELSAFTNGAAIVEQLSSVANQVINEDEAPPEKVSDSGNYIGRTLTEIIETLGEPRMMLKVGSETTYRYDKVELMSSDGIHVTSQAVPAN